MVDKSFECENASENAAARFDLAASLIDLEDFEEGKGGLVRESTWRGTTLRVIQLTSPCSE